MASPANHFVVERGDSVGFGWCTGVAGGVATIQYSDLPGSVAEERRVPVAEVVVRDLPLEMRVWVRNKGFGWWPGRTKGREPDGNYLVRLAGVGPVVRVPPWSIEVRWDQPLVSATAALAVGMTDSLEYQRARASVMTNLVAQRGASLGFTSVLSASVRPFHHQIDVLTRVLNDPVLRFVLADEVGLGKTIEAGLIIRQMFLDHPESRVAVCTPRTLGGQWLDELGGKLRLRRQLRSDLLRVVDQEELGELVGAPLDLLVIDEAHQLMDGALGDSNEMELLCKIAHAAPSLLLLTATPLRGNAETFLGLLHLVDPEAYRLDDVNEFRRRLEVRHEQASSIELLAPNVPEAVVQGVLQEFAETYQDDSLLQRLIHSGEAALETEPQPDKALRDVADHMRETYRLSRRVIRHRRSAVTGDGFPVPGRRIDIIEVEDPARDAIDDFLDQWRRCLQESGSNAGPVAVVFARGVEAGLAGPPALTEFIQRRLADLAGNENGTEGALLRQTKAILARKGNVRYDSLIRHLRSSPVTKTVIFTSFSKTLSEVSDLLLEAFGVAHVAVHEQSMTADDQDEAARLFVTDPSCQILICDASGEEGRNLQAAGQIVHLDLPLSVNRLEQRIGRADRYNEFSPEGGVPSVVFAESASAWVAGHLYLLSEGIGVFSQSVATLQRLLAEFESELRERLFTHGVRAFEQDVARLRARLDDERNQIDLLEELEATLTAREFSPAAIDELVRLEADWPATARAFDELTSEAAGIHLSKSERRGVPGVFSYSVDPTLQTIPLIPAHQQEQLIPLLEGSRTFDRDVALRNPDAQLVRLGDPLVDWIETYLRIDEGGRAWAVWRYVPDWGEPEAWFCFDFVVEFDKSALHEFEGRIRRRLRRRGDAFLPPRTERVWTDGTREASAELIDSVLERSNDKRVRGVALRGPRWQAALDHFPEWSSLCIRAEQQAREILWKREELLDWRRNAEASANREATRRLQVLKLWTDRLAPGHQQERAKRELGRSAGPWSTSPDRDALVDEATWADRRPSGLVRTTSPFRPARSSGTPRRRPRRGLVKYAAAALVALGLVGGPATVVLAENARPGEVLWSVRLLIEDARLVLEGDEEKDMVLRLEFAARRVGDLQYVTAGGGPATLVEKVTENLAEHTDAAMLTYLRLTADRADLPALRSQMQGVLGQSVDVLQALVATACQGEGDRHGPPAAACPGLQRALKNSTEAMDVVHAAPGSRGESGEATPGQGQKKEPPANGKEQERPGQGQDKGPATGAKDQPSGAKDQPNGGKDQQPPAQGTDKEPPTKGQGKGKGPPAQGQGQGKGPPAQGNPPAPATDVRPPAPGSPGSGKANAGK